MLLVIASLFVIGFFSVNVITGYISQRIIERNNLACSNLAYELSQLEEPFNKTCTCYYSNCGSSHEDLTQSFCRCDCIENNTMAGVCIRVSK
ncbi:MAG: hypothetical protein PHW96_03930 [Candidatus Nanoarchaeia archaeon]|nr:hypothetical protein [Candidatus Nanoarchaeia archaeon]